MINKKEFYVSVSEEDDIDKIFRLQSTLQGRLNLLNMFENLINPKYQKLTIKNIGIDIKNEDHIIDYMLKSNKYIEEYLTKSVLDWIHKNGTPWQRLRIFKCFKEIKTFKYDN